MESLLARFKTWKEATPVDDDDVKFVTYQLGIEKELVVQPAMTGDCGGPTWAETKRTAAGDASSSTERESIVAVKS